MMLRLTTSTAVQLLSSSNSEQDFVYIKTIILQAGYSAPPVLFLIVCRWNSIFLSDRNEDVLMTEISMYVAKNKDKR